MEKKKYESSKKYSKKYNSENINVQLDRILVEKVRNRINISLKEYIEMLLKTNL